MDKSTTNLSYYDNQEADGFRYAVSKQMTDARSGMFGEAYTVFKDMVIINQGKWRISWICQYLKNKARMLESSLYKSSRVVAEVTLAPFRESKVQNF